MSNASLEAGCWNVKDGGKQGNDVGCWKPTWKRGVEAHLCVLTMSVRVCANEFCVYLKHNDMPWEQFIWLKIKGVQGVSLSVKILKSTEEFSFF